MSKFTMIVLLLLVSAGHAFAQWGQCDPLNRTWFQTYDSLDYPTIDSVCAYPPQPQPVNNCGTLGAAFVTYSDMTIMDDGTIEAFASSQDLSQYSATADVQMDTTVTMPDGSTLYRGSWSPHGFVMVSIPLSIDATNSSDVYTVSSSHELNWPGCDGYGTIVSTTALFRIATTNYQFSAYLDGGCVYQQQCGTTKPTCGSPYAEPAQFTSPACPLYLYQQQLVVNGACFPVGRYKTGSNPIPCD